MEPVRVHSVFHRAALQTCLCWLCLLTVPQMSAFISYRLSNCLSLLLCDINLIRIKVTFPNYRLALLNPLSHWLAWSTLRTHLHTANYIAAVFHCWDVHIIFALHVSNLITHRTLDLAARANSFKKLRSLRKKVSLCEHSLLSVWAADFRLFNNERWTWAVCIHYYLIAWIPSTPSQDCTFATRHSFCSQLHNKHYSKAEIFLPLLQLMPWAGSLISSCQKPSPLQNNKQISKPFLVPQVIIFHYFSGFRYLHIYF